MTSAPQASDKTTPTGLPGLTERESALVKRLLSSPLDFPQQYLAWLKKYLEANPPRIGITGLDGYDQLVSSIPDPTTIPNPELDYAEITTGQTISATAEASATTVITGASVTYDGTQKIHIEGYSPRTNRDGTALFLVLWDDTAGAAIGRVEAGNPSATALRRRLTPTSGARAYSLRAYRTAGTTAGTTVGAGAGGTTDLLPAYLRITRAS